MKKKNNLATSLFILVFILLLFVKNSFASSLYIIDDVIFNDIYFFKLIEAQDNYKNVSKFLSLHKEYSPLVYLVVLKVKGENKKFYVLKKSFSINKIFDKFSIKLNRYDRVRVNKYKDLYSQALFVHIVRVEKEVSFVKKYVNLPVKVKFDFSKPPAYSKIISEGKPSLYLYKRIIWKKDGKITKKEFVKYKLLKKGEPKVIVKGLSIRNFASRYGRNLHVNLDLSKYRCIVMEATGYEPSYLSCGPYANGITAIGLKAGYGVVAVDPKVIPLRTKLYIEGYGFAIAGDVGGDIKGYRIDLGFNSYREAIQFGRRKVKVYILGR